MLVQKIAIVCLLLSSGEAVLAGELEQYQSLKSEYEKSLQEKNAKYLTQNSVKGISEAFQEITGLIDQKRSFVAGYETAINTALSNDRQFLHDLISWSQSIVSDLKNHGLGTAAFASHLRNLRSAIALKQQECQTLASRKLTAEYDEYASKLYSLSKALGKRIASLNTASYVNQDYQDQLHTSFEAIKNYSFSIWEVRNQTIGFARMPQACYELDELESKIQQAMNFSDAIAHLEIDKIEEARNKLKIVLELIDNRQKAYELKESIIYLFRGIEQAFAINADQSEFEKMVINKGNFDNIIPTINSMLDNELFTASDREFIVTEVNAAADRVSDRYFDLADDVPSLRIKVYRRMRYLGLKIRKVGSSTAFSEEEKATIFELADKVGVSSSGQVVVPPEFSTFSAVIKFCQAIGNIEDMIGDRV